VLNQICYYLPSYLAESQIYLPNLDEPSPSPGLSEHEHDDLPFDQETKTNGGMRDAGFVELMLAALNGHTRNIFSCRLAGWSAVIEAGGRMPQEVIDLHK
jgi:hypothetical protein